MGKISDKIINLQLSLADGCSEMNKKIITKYWTFDSDFKFSNMPSHIKDDYNISQIELTSIIGEYSSMTFYLHCQSCDSLEKQTTLSQTSFKSVTSSLNNRWRMQNFKCKYCYAIEYEQRKEQQSQQLKEEQNRNREQLLQRITDGNKAIDEKAWIKLSDFENTVLKHAIQLSNFQELKSYYFNKGMSTYKMLFTAMRILAAENLMNISIDSCDSSIIKGYQFLPRLNEEFTYIATSEKDIDNSSNVIFDRETNEIKFKLTINKNQDYPDSPSYAGTVTFNEKIVINPKVEYVFGMWKRSKDDLYLTMIPLENIKKLPNQKRIAKIPISLRKGIEDFLSSIGRDDNFKL